MKKYTLTEWLVILSLIAFGLAMIAIGIIREIGIWRLILKDWW